MWDRCYERDIEKLEKNTIRSGTNCNRSDKFASKDSLYFETGWETLANRRETRKLTTFFIKFIINYALLIYLTVYLQLHQMSIVITLEIIRIMFHPDAD